MRGAGRRLVGGTEVRGLESVFGVAASLLSLAGPVLVDVSSASASSVHIIRLGNGSNGATVRASVGTQVVVDLMTGPGRSPSEAEELLEWMKRNEQSWRR